MSRDVLEAPVRLPIGLRLPNPPAPFVGREGELARLRSLLEAGRVALVTGPAGIGKTALALKALEALRGDGLAAGPATLVTVNAQRPGGLVEHLLDVLGRALALPPDWRVLGADRGLALATLIDLADAGPWTLLLDDAHAAHEAELEEVVVAARDYARASRWVMTAQSVGPGLRRAVPAVGLGHLDAQTLLDLSAAVFPERGSDEHARAVRRCDGNPRCLLASRSRGTGEAPGLDDFVLRLAALERPLRPEVLAAVTPMPEESEVQALVQRGQLLQLPRGLWLRRDASESPAARPSVALAVELAAGLEASADDDARLEAVRLWLFGGRPDRAVDLLALCGEALCERGLAAELWALLPPRAANGSVCAELDRWRAWAAFEWGDPRAAADIVDAEPADYLSAHLRARRRIAAGAFDEARVAAERAAELAPSDRQHDRALCRAGRALFSSGRPAEVLALLDRIRDSRDDVLVEAELLRAESLTVLGRRDEASAVCEALLERVADVPPAARLRALLGVARAYLMQQRLVNGERVLEALLSARAERAGDAVSGRTALELAAAVAALRGRFGRLRDLAPRLLAFERAYPVRALFTRSYLVSADQWQRSPAVHRDGARRLLGDARAHASPIAADVACYAEVLCAQADQLDGLAPPAASDSPTPKPPSPAMARSRDAVLAGWRARWGAAPELPAEPDDGALEHVALFALAHANAHLAGGRAEEAERTVLRALPLVDGGGYALHVFALRRTLAMACWAQAAWDRLAAEAAALERLGEQHEAPRLLDEAAFFGALGRVGSPPPPETLEAWAADDEAIPTRTRWTRWLLGGNPPLDPVERRLLETGVATHGWGRAAHVARAAEDGATTALLDEPWRGGRGLDRERQLVWGPGRIVADLSKHAVLWSLLETLAGRGGRASKEELVLAVWDVAEYHPLKHDNRLRVAVRKLRNRLGEGEAGIETDEDGYALGGVWRRR